MKYLCEHECERSSVPININTKAKATIYLGISFSLISVVTMARSRPCTAKASGSKVFLLIALGQESAKHNLQNAQHNARDLSFRSELRKGTGR